MLFGGATRRRAAWTQVATELGGTHHPQSRWWRSDEHITATVHGAPVKLDVYVVSTGKSSQAYTRVAADFVHGPGPRMKVSRQGVLASIGKALGMQDATLGDPAFDERFVLKTDELAVTRRLWTPTALAHLVTSLGEVQVTSDDTTIKSVAAGRWSDPAIIRAAFEMIGELAARDLHGVVALRAIDGATLVQPAGERPRAELDTGVRVVVMAEDRGDRLVTSARVYEPLGLAPLALEVEDGRAELASQLPQGAQLHLARVGSGSLAIGDTLAFHWRDLELDPARLRAGAELLGAIATGARGVYR